MLTAEEAAETARKHGLTLTDASALRQLADTAEQADRLAARFAVPSGDDLADAVRDRIRGV